MAIVDFVDVDGRHWTVFQVQRSSSKPGTVTPGREGGWLVFSNGSDRRRLAPVPVDWESLDAAALGNLCTAAQEVDRDRAQQLLERRRTMGGGPHPKRRATDVETAAAQPVARATPSITNEPAPGAPLSPDLMVLVRERALSARAEKQTAVAAIMALRALLLTHDIAASSDAFREARRIFLDAFYFRRS